MVLEGPRYFLGVLIPKVVLEGLRANIYYYKEYTVTNCAQGVNLHQAVLIQYKYCEKILGDNYDDFKFP